MQSMQCTAGYQVGQFCGFAVDNLPWQFFSLTELDCNTTSKISMLATSFHLGLHFCSDTVLSDQHTRPFVSSAVIFFFLCVCGQMSFVFQLFSASQHQACSGEIDHACVGIMAFSRWKDHKLGNKSCCDEGNQTCLSSYTYKDQYWDYACLVVLISVSFHYQFIREYAVISSFSLLVSSFLSLCLYANAVQLTCDEPSHLCDRWEHNYNPSLGILRAVNSAVPFLAMEEASGHSDIQKHSSRSLVIV